MKVRAVWEFEADVEDLDPKQVDIPGVAKDSARCELMYMLRKRELIADDFEFIAGDELAVDHAEWVTEAKTFRIDSQTVYVTSRCSHCGRVDAVKTLPKDLWEMGYKNTYKPDTSNYCRDCGRKMVKNDDLVRLEDTEETT